MTVRVRFAPSPTGYLHIGGARTALYNYLFAKANGGKYILRIEDTDLERSKAEFEQLQIADLEWLGIIHDEGPDKPNPKYGPYRQSERLDIYMKYALEMIANGKAYYDFCTEIEIEAMKEKAAAEGHDPQYEGKWKDPAFDKEAHARVAAGEKAAIRFRAPKKVYSFKDGVKGDVSFPENMVGDFVIMRSSGLPVYNYCCVVDDMLMDISHVIRAEEHLNNTVRQLMIYEALNAKPPIFAHVSLIIGADRQKLSKRHGATSVNLYRNDHYLPEALCNYLTLLGWSHPQEVDIFAKADIQDLFSMDRFSSHSAMYDVEKLNWVNSQHIKKTDNVELVKIIATLPHAEDFNRQSEEWKLAAIVLLKEKVQFIPEIVKLSRELIMNEEIEMSEPLKEILAWENTPKIIAFIDTQISSISTPFITEAQLNGWMEQVKKELGVKGKFLFQGVRAALTGHDHGPDLKFLIPLTPVSVIKKRVAQLKK